MRWIFASSPALGTTGTLISSLYGHLRVRQVVLKARPQNAGAVYVGQVNSTVSPASTLNSTNGWTLERGQEAPPQDFGTSATYFYEYYALSGTAGTDRVDFAILVDDNA